MHGAVGDGTVDEAEAMTDLVGCFDEEALFEASRVLLIGEAREREDAPSAMELREAKDVGHHRDEEIAHRQGQGGAVFGGRLDAFKERRRVDLASVLIEKALRIHAEEGDIGADIGVGEPRQEPLGEA